MSDTSSSGESSTGSTTGGLNGNAFTVGTGGGPNVSPGKPFPVDAKAIVERLKFVAMNPVSCWETLKNDGDSISDVYRKYLMPLAVLSAVATFLGLEIIGIPMPLFGTYRPPFFGQLVSSVLHCLASLAMIYIGAMVIQQVALKFEATVDQTAAFKLLAYSSFLGIAAGVLNIVPALGVVAIFVGLYSLYLYYQGVPKMVSVSAEKRIPFTAVSLVAVIVAAFVLFFIVRTVASMFIPEPIFRVPGSISSPPSALYIEKR